ncbi:MAG: RNA polymerase sigma factor [Candidatus Kapaibacterium sp.]|jgi:RNA polymerase sigma-70 factor (ECF subfamily)
MSASTDRTADEYYDGEEPVRSSSGTTPDALLDHAKSEVLKRLSRNGKQPKANEQADGAATANGKPANSRPARDSKFIDTRSRVLKPGERTDEELFRGYQEGDQQAFLKLYERYKSMIFAYCARTVLSAGLDEELVEDTFQEVFLRVAQYQHTFTGGEFRAWIFTVTRHTCLSTKKKGIQHRISTERVGDGENLDNDVASEVRNALSMVNDPLENLSMSEQTALLLKAIAELPETYREALILSDYEGLTYEEIGRITGTSLSTIRIRVFRAKARLRKVLLPIIGDSV